MEEKNDWKAVEWLTREAFWRGEEVFWWSTPLKEPRNWVMGAFSFSGTRHIIRDSDLRKRRIFKQLS